MYKILSIESSVRSSFGIDNGGDRLFNVKNRTEPHADARASLQHIIYNSIGLTVEKIGRLFNQDHSTISHNVRKVNKILELNRENGIYADFAKKHNNALLNLQKRN